MTKQNINVGTPNKGDGDPLRVAFQKINANFTELYAAVGSGGSGTTDRLVSGDKELVLINDGIIVGVQFPAQDTARIGIQGSEIGANPNPGQTDPAPLILSSFNNDVWITPNAQGPRPAWRFKTDASLEVPSFLPHTFRATFDGAHNTIGREPTQTPWYYDVTFALTPNGTVEIQIDGNRVWNYQPNYVDGDTYDFTSDDHHIPGYTLTITLHPVSAGQAGWTADFECTVPPTFSSTVSSNSPIKLTANSKSWILNTDGDLVLPDSGVIRNHDGTQYGGASGGASVTTSDTAPVSPAVGDLWYDIVGGRMYVYYDSSWIDSNPVDGSGGSTGNFTFGGNTVTNTFGMLLATDRGTLALGTNMEAPGAPSHFHIAFDGSNAYPSPNDLYFGDDFNYLQLVNSGQGVVVGANDRSGGDQHLWRFNTDGKLTIPGEIQSEAGTGDVVIEANDGTARTWTFGADGITHIPGMDSGIAVVQSANHIQVNASGKVWSFATNGVLTIPDGGDIRNIHGTTVLGGSSLPTYNLSGNPGVLKVDGGGSVSWGINNGLENGGNLATLTGTDCNLRFQRSSTLFAEFIINDTVLNPQAVGDLKLTSNKLSGQKDWTFNTDGSMTFPNGAKLDGGTAYKFATDNGVTQYIDLRDTSGRGFYTDGDGFSLRSNGSHTWKFGTDGNLTVPGGIILPSDTTLDITTTNTMHPPMGTHTLSLKAESITNDAIYLTVATQSYHGVAIDQSNKTIELGNLSSVPARIIYDTATPIGRFGDVEIQTARIESGSESSVWISTQSRDYQWRFDGAGKLTFPNSTVQTTAYQTTTAPGTSKGVSGNKAGMVAFDSGNFYYCKQDYTDGVDDIWVKTAWTSTSW